MAKQATKRVPVIGKRGPTERPSWGRLERAYAIRAYRAGIRDDEGVDETEPDKPREDKLLP